MKNTGSVSLLLLLTVACAAPQPVPPAPEATAADSDRIRAVPFTAVTLQDEFWAPRFARNRGVTIPHIMEQNELTGRVDNFRKGAGLMEGAYEGRRFNDTDIYKVVEAASYAIAQQPDAALETQLDELIELIGAAQQERGKRRGRRTPPSGNPPQSHRRSRDAFVSSSPSNSGVSSQFLIYKN